MNGGSGFAPPSMGRGRRFAAMLALVTAGEVVFALPFVIARVFRPTLLDVFGITNLQLGTAFSLYGLVAMAAYLAGGPLADRFPSRGLIAVALVGTAAGGAVYATIPPLATLKMLFAWWGLTTILLFWAAMIRATREWGGATGQGRAYGILDGGRGLMAALLASATVAVFAARLPVDAAAATLEQRAAAFGDVLWIVTGLTVATAALAFACLPGTSAARRHEPGEGRGRGTLDGIRACARLPAVWLQAGIVVCAYAGYKSTDDFSLFARDAFGYDDVRAASVGTISFWVRPFAAFGAGWIADRVGVSRAVGWSFAVMIAGNLVLASGLVRPGTGWLLVTTIAATAVGIHALRGVYFALFGEGRVPWRFTGSAVGLVSWIGYTPDVFMGPLMGFLTDRSPGAAGHRHLFLVTAGFGLAGWLATLAFRRVTTGRGPLRA